MQFWIEWYIKYCISKNFDFWPIAIIDFIQTGELPRAYGWSFFPVIYDTFPDLCAKFQLYINFFQVWLVFSLILLY